MQESIGRPPKVCITLPAYRAERTLAKTIADIPEGIADELILVDDNSPDNTAQLARDLGIDVYVHPENRRYGGNQKTCYSRALLHGADIVVLLHPDYQYDPKAVPLLIAPILAGHADMTFGSRFAATGDPLGGGMPLYRFLGNRATTMFENLLLGSRFTEMHSGLRAYTRKCLLSLPFLSYSDEFVFDSQLLVDVVTLGMRVVEVPIMTRYTHESSSAPVGASLSYVAKSIGYAGRRRMERGRRGRKSPLTIGTTKAVPVTAEDAPPARNVSATGSAASLSQRRRFEFMVNAARWFWSPDGTMGVSGAADALLTEIATDRGWDVSTVVGDEAMPRDVAVVDQPIETIVDPAAFLASLARGLSDEGLLIATLARSASPSPRSVSPPELVGFLTAAGFHLVEWTRLPERCGPGVMIAARRG